MPSPHDFWRAFCARVRLASRIPLFATEADGRTVRTGPRCRGGRQGLLRSPEMEQLMMAQVGLLLRDFDAQKGANESTPLTYEGLIYCMYTIDAEGHPEPLYIGKTETLGKKGDNLSANIKGIKTTTQHPFARWGYGYTYHLGDLSAVVLGHDTDHREQKYIAWADALFEKDGDSYTTRLKRPVYFWTKAWRHSDVGPWIAFGPTPLTFLEYLLIGVSSRAFPELLNEEGVNRGR